MSDTKDKAECDFAMALLDVVCMYAAGGDAVAEQFLTHTRKRVEALRQAKAEGLNACTHRVPAGWTCLICMVDA